MTSIAGAQFPGGFTVLMAVWQGDSPASIDRAIRSVFHNTLQPNAFVLVVDGPAPEPLAAAIQELESQFALRVFRFPKHVGLARALNLGLGLVETEWVVRADADDFNLPHRFERLGKAIDCETPPDLLGSAILEVELDGTGQAIRNVPLSHEEIVRHMRYRNPFNHMTVAYRRELAQTCGGYPDIHLKEDYALWALMVREGAVTKNVGEVLVHATAGVQLYNRRGGWSYAYAEVELQRHLVACGIKGPFWAFLHGAARGFVFLLLSGMRAWIYRHFLRSSASSSA